MSVKKFTELTRSSQETTLSVKVSHVLNAKMYSDFLHDLGFNSYYGPDFCEGTIKGSYKQVMEVMRILRKEGFVW